MFRDSGPIRQPCVVFPRTAVTIAHEAGPPFLADATVATLYNEGQRYERRAVSAGGDRCDWYAVTPALAREVARTLDPVVDDTPRPIRHAQAPVDVQLYRRQRRFFRAVADGRLADPLAIEETTLSLVQDALGRASADASRRERACRHRGRLGLVEAACRLIARHFTAQLTLSSLSARLGCSPFHLCRAFRAITGTTLHAYQNDLRLRAALEAVESGRPLTDIALDHGFSSHSHFTEAFHRAFGVPPSRALADAPARRAARAMRHRARSR